MAPPKLKPVDPQPDESEIAKDRLAQAHDHVRKLEGERRMLIEKRDQTAELLVTVQSKRAHVTRMVIGDPKARKPLAELSSREIELDREARDLCNAIEAVDRDLEEAREQVRLAEQGLKEGNVDEILEQCIELTGQLVGAITEHAQPLVQQWRRAHQELARASGDRSAQVYGGHRLAWLVETLLETAPVPISIRRMIEADGGLVAHEKRVLTQRIAMKRRRDKGGA